MKRIAILPLMAAAFLGVFGAIRLDRYLESRNEPTVDWGESPALMPVLQPTESQSAPSIPDFRGAAKKVNPSVVSVDRFNDVRRWFDDRVVETQSGSGSGVIVSDTGIVVTNNHVVQRASRVRVRLTDRRTFDAEVLGTDPRSDLAVLKITAGGLTPIEVGTSKGLEVGQWVVAVGNPLGFNNTVSVGVVSSLKRNLPIGDQGMVDAIQTDAAINPGNSGGALCDTQGRLIGINSAIASTTGGSVGIGFAIPVDRVKSVVADIVKFGYARYPGLGIQYREDFDGMLAHPEVRDKLAELSQSENVPNRGIVVFGASGGAAAAGIGQYDVILEISGEAVDGTFDLNRVLIPRNPGESVNVKFWSKGKMKTAKVTLQEIKPV